MPTLEEAMREALRGHTPTRDPGDVFERLEYRRRRRTLTRKLGTIGLVIAVLGGTAGAFALLGHAFGTSQPLSTPTASNGALVVSIQSEDGFSLYVLPPEKQDLAPAASASAAGPDMMTRLTSQPGTEDVEPAVSPDGTTVAFVRHARDLADGQGVLSTIGIDGTRENLVTRAPAQAEGPTWSPDGQWIVFGAADEPDGRALWAIHPDGSDLHRAVSDDIPLNPQSPAWSPDGDRIVFSGSAGVAEPPDLWLADADGSDVRNLTSTPDVAETDPTWSPDGSSIAFATPDGIEQIPSGGGPMEVLVSASGVAGDRLPRQPAWSPDGRYLTFAFGPEAPLPSVVYLLPADASTAFPLSQGWDFSWQPIPANSVTPNPSVTPQLDLGLGYDVCRVSSMPINTNGVRGAAYVFTKKAAEGCPAHGEGLVGVDFDNDLVVDATYGPLEDCYIRCEAFAAPDVNADGVSEIAVSTEGADGYGVYLFVVSTSGSPSIDPIHVEDPQNLAQLLDPLQFAWADVAAHFEGARCGTLDDGTPTFILQGGDKLPPDTEVRSTTLVLGGTTATVIDTSTTTIPLADAPVPGHELCGTPLYNSAANFPGASDPTGLDLGRGLNLCDTSSIRADFDGNGVADTVWVGRRITDGRCTHDGEPIAAIDENNDGQADGYTALPRCEICQAYAATDLGPGAGDELVVLLQSSSTPEYAIYEANASGSSRSAGLYPIFVRPPGYPAGRFPAGQQLTFFSGGDEGFSAAIGCENYPVAPILVVAWSNHPVEGPGADVEDVYVTRLRLGYEGAEVLSSDHFSQPSTDPLPISGGATACGVDWYP